MIDPSYDPNISLNENLAANGYGQRDDGHHHKRTVFATDTGEEIGPMDQVECTDWLKERVRVFERRGAE